MAYWAAEFPNFSKYSRDSEISTLMSLLGPIGLVVVWFMTEHGHYGFAWTRSQFANKNEYGLSLYREGKLFWQNDGY